MVTAKIFYRSVLIALFTVVMVGCSRSSNKPNLELVHDMLEQPAIKAQDSVAYDSEKSGMMLPPAGSVARGYQPYSIATPDQAERELRNPLRGDMSPEVVDQGRIYYERFCLVCHGEIGDGRGPVHEKFGGLIKTLVSGPVVSWSDERIYHVVTAGQGIMGSYEAQMPDERIRWSVVNYVRSLQEQAK